MKLALASTSPARHAVLQSAHVRFTPVAAHVDEGALIARLSARDADFASDARRQVAALAAEKARAGMQAARTLAQTPLVLGCDSLFSIDGQIFGKPKTPAVARARLAQMAGRAGELHTGHHLIRLADGAEFSQVRTSTVRIGPMTSAEIDAYVATGEPLWVAGCFTLEGYGGVFIDAVEGCHHNVLGLSLPTLRELVGQAGFSLTDFWQLPTGEET